MLILVMLVHAAGMRWTSNHVLRRSTALLLRPKRWRADLLTSGTVFVLLGLHTFEMFAWAASLVYSGLIPEVYKGSTTTVSGSATRSVLRSGRPNTGTSSLNTSPGAARTPAA